MTGCAFPDSWSPAGGDLVPVDRLADALLDPAHDRDGDDGHPNGPGTMTWR